MLNDPECFLDRKPNAWFAQKSMFVTLEIFRPEKILNIAKNYHGFLF